MTRWAALVIIAILQIYSGNVLAVVMNWSETQWKTNGRNDGCPPSNYETPNGTIHSPNYPNDYPNNQDCDYRITVAAGSRVQITFLSFLTQAGPDYVNTYDGLSDGLPLQARLSGNISSPFTIRSTGNTIRAHFHSDHSVVLSGFVANYITITDGQFLPPCPPEIYQEASGSLHSANYPNDYQNFQDCHYRITVAAGSRVQITFHAFITEYSYDFVDIFNGFEECEPLQKRLTGNLTALPLTVTSVGNTMRLHFRSDFYTVYSGFLANYTSTTDGPQLPRCPPMIYGGPSGAVHSPGYPHNYENNQDCDYRITVAADYRVQIIFYAFITELGFDFVDIFDGLGECAPLLKRISGSHLTMPYSIRSTGNTMRVHFHTDHSREYSGFGANYVTITDVPQPPLQCPPSNYPGPSGSLNSPGWPSIYGDNQTCDYYITVNVAMVVQINFTSFNTENRWDYVDLFDGFGADANRIVRLTGSLGRLNQTVFNSTTNTMRLKFVSDWGLVLTGFFADYRGANPPPATLQPTPTTTLPSRECDSHFRFDAVTHLCYRYDKRSMSWTGAQTACAYMGAHLASVHSEAVNAFIAQYIVSETSGHSDRWFVWIGAHKYGRNYAWSDGTHMDYTNWLPGQPRDADGLCAAIQSWPPIGWRALQCNYALYPFVCIKTPHASEPRHN